MNCGTACPTSIQPPPGVCTNGQQKLRDDVDSDAAAFRWSEWSARMSRLNAPREDGEKLIEPPPSLAGAMAAVNRQHIAGSNYDVQGRRLSQLAIEARQELLAEALQFSRSYRDVTLPAGAETIFLAGHQPEMFHPGVWYKNFVLGRLAQRFNAVPINLVIDSDAVKTTSLRVPGGSLQQPRVESISFDHSGPEAPFEQRAILDRELFSSFGERVTKQLHSLVGNPIVTQYWPRVIERSRVIDNLGMCLSQARHQMEGTWGLQTLEIPQSRVCDLPAVRWFIAHMLVNLPRLWKAYNTALAEYRREHKLRSSAHPAPDLASDGDWLEAPFWIWSADNPRRRHLFVRQHNDELILTDRAGLEAVLSISPESDAATATAQLLALAERGIRIRTRALITTMTARLLLGDLFLHGIGGAKYDQVTDRLIAGFFGLEPPGYMAVSGTLHLPVSHAAPHSDELLQLRHQIRELEFHPEQFVAQTAHASTSGDTNVAQWTSEKRRWIAAQPTPETAKQRCHAIRQANESLQPSIAPLREKWTAAAEQLAREIRGETILSSREYAFVLFPESLLTKFFQ